MAVDLKEPEDNKNISASTVKVADTKSSDTKTLDTKIADAKSLVAAEIAMVLLVMAPASRQHFKSS